MTYLIAIDPGTTESAIVCWNCPDAKLVWAKILPNEELREFLLTSDACGYAIEMVACYGMAVGKEVFETCVWIGRFKEILIQRKKSVRLVYRQQAKLHLCHSTRAKDPNVRQALIDKFGEAGTKKNPGPLFGVSSHIWAALAVAVFASENAT